MKLVITGSRGIENRQAIWAILDKHQFDTLIHGGARGVDKIAGQYAQAKGIKEVVLKPNWRLGRGAAMANNAKMAEIGDALVAIHDGVSTGTAHMVDTMRKLGKPVDYNVL